MNNSIKIGILTIILFMINTNYEVFLLLNEWKQKKDIIKNQIINNSKSKTMNKLILSSFVLGAIQASRVEVEEKYQDHE